MKKEREYYIDSDDPDKVLWGMSWRAIVIGIVLIILCVGGGWAIFGLKVFTSPIKGAGDVVIANNDAKNRVQAQARFEALFNGIQAIDKNLDVLHDAMVANPKDRIAAETYRGTVMSCNIAVGDYNAEARKTLSVDWRTWDLPAQIDPNDPTTDCKEAR